MNINLKQFDNSQNHTTSKRNQIGTCQCRKQKQEDIVCGNIDKIIDIDKFVGFPSHFKY